MNINKNLNINININTNIYIYIYKYIYGSAERPSGPLNPPRACANGVLDLTAFVLAFLLQEGLAILLEERGTLSL